MNCGKLTESIYERSVIKVVKTNSTENRKFYDGAGLGADCAILAGEKASGIMSGQALASGLDAKVAVRAYMAATNHVIACCVNGAASGLFDAYANMTLVVPKRLREIKVRGMIEAAAVQAEETGVPLLSCNVQVLESVTDAVAVCVVNAGVENRCDGKIVPLRKRAHAGEDIVMTKWLGLEGTAIMAAGSLERLCARYPADLVEEAADFYRYLSIAPEAATAVKSGACGIHDVSQGGIFAALWELAHGADVGLEIDLRKLPVRQETIELCEFFDLNPYELLSGGCLLMTAEDGNGLVLALEKEGIPAVVVGKTTAGNDRVLLNEEERRYLEPPKTDQIYQLNKNGSHGEVSVETGKA